MEPRTARKATGRGARATPAADLGAYLERVFARYHRPAFLTHDPLLFLHRYRRRDDVEVVGFIAALLAYGRVEGILQTIERILGPLGAEPARAIQRFDGRRDARAFDGIVHRWTRSEDVVALLVIVRRVYEEAGSLERLFLAGYERGAPGAMRGALARFVRALRSLAPDVAARPRGLPFLLPDPDAGSACKRLNLYMRWMVRRDDPLDRGLWRAVAPSDLIMPIDTHVARIARNLGLSASRTVGWTMAEEVTTSLARIDPHDPTRFDFSLCRLGILQECPTRQEIAKCRACELRAACRLYASLSRRGAARGPMLRSAGR